MQGIFYLPAATPEGESTGNVPFLLPAAMPRRAARQSVPPVELEKWQIAPDMLLTCCSRPVRRI